MDDVNTFRFFCNRYGDRNVVPVLALIYDTSDIDSGVLSAEVTMFFFCQVAKENRIKKLFFARGKMTIHNGLHRAYF